MTLADVLIKAVKHKSSNTLFYQYHYGHKADGHITAWRINALMYLCYPNDCGCSTGCQCRNAVDFSYCWCQTGRSVLRQCWRAVLYRLDQTSCMSTPVSDISSCSLAVFAVSGLRPSKKTCEHCSSWRLMFRNLNCFEGYSAEAASRHFIWGGMCNFLQVYNTKGLKRVLVGLWLLKGFQLG